jgi:hypothetical protein
VDVAHNVILIDGTPRIGTKTLSMCPLARPAAAQAVSKTRAEFLALASYLFVGHHDAALGQEPQNVP